MMRELLRYYGPSLVMVVAATLFIALSTRWTP